MAQGVDYPNFFFILLTLFPYKHSFFICGERCQFIMIKISTNWVLWPGKQLGALFFLSESDKKEITFFFITISLSLPFYSFNRSKISLVFLSPYIRRWRVLLIVRFGFWAGSREKTLDVLLRRKKLVPWHTRHYSRLFSVIKETGTAIAHHQHGRRSSGTTCCSFFVGPPLSRC